MKTFLEELDEFENGLGAVQGDAGAMARMIRLLLDGRYHSQTCTLGAEESDVRAELIEKLWAMAKRR